VTALKLGTALAVLGVFVGAGHLLLLYWQPLARVFKYSLFGEQPSESHFVNPVTERPMVRAWRSAFRVGAISMLFVGLFGWAWHGDWSSSGNPFDWNQSAQADWTMTTLVAGLAGFVIRLAVVIYRSTDWRRGW